MLMREEPLLKQQVCSSSTYSLSSVEQSSGTVKTRVGEVVSRELFRYC